MSKDIEASMPALVQRESSSSAEDEVKHATSNDGITSPEEVPLPGFIDTFLGRDRKVLQKDPIVWNRGFAGFCASLSHRTKGVFTRRFLLCLVAGQTLSLAITGTSVLTTELGMHGWSMPTFQTFFLYFFLNLVYTPYTIHRYGFKAWGKMLVTDGWKYLLLAAIDVEANFLVIKAYGYTDLLSCMLLDAWATPACMIFAFFFVKARYHWSQIVAVLICILGLGLLVASDDITDKNYPANNRVLGDILMLIGATGYGLSNSLEEFFVRQRPLYEVVGQMGFWGSIINAIQGVALEHHLFHTSSWSGRNIGYLVGYTCCMLFLYSTAPVLYRLASSPFYNISLLSSDFYGLCFGLALFGYSPYWLYFVAYALVLIGLVAYFWVARPEATRMNVVSRGKQADREEIAGVRKVLGDERI
ncbi:BQ5605_C021g09382 [Microbotryum silenes-dioicae]|uniref:BQ5605_C021g09382 protein n=1 Tax=Microbotryum silenes-dioicae TaxID=796604 RepID=A0A2X0N6E1_9BASI|nr:BQ5605_C021g09382 [Microbotryum silenes-dioicae]